MSRSDLNYRSLKADLRADAAASLVCDVSEATIRSLHVIPVAERRENLLALAKAALAAARTGASRTLTVPVDDAVAYYAVTADPMPAFGRLLVAVRDCDAVEADKALRRLAGEAA